MKRGLIVFLSLFAISIVSAAVCGDGQCDAGSYTEYPLVEDSSNCYIDCGFVEYKRCQFDVDLNVEYSCEFQNKEYKIEVNDINGCGGTGSLSISFSASYDRESENINGLAPETWYNLDNGVKILVKPWPCAVGIKNFMLVGDAEPLENTFTINQNSFNLNTDQTLVTTSNIQGWLSSPFCNLDIFKENSNEAIGGYSGNCGDFDRNLQELGIGEYIIANSIYDNTKTGTFGEETLNFIVHECEMDEECDDGKFLTKDICSNDKVKMCKNPINILWIILVIIIILIIILVLYFGFRKN